MARCSKKVFYALYVSVLSSPENKLYTCIHFCRDTKSKIYDGHVLGYITPWNGHGYDVAKIFGNKLSTVSPVWLQVVPSEDSSSSDYAIHGTHDVDKKWMGTVRKNAPGLRIVPR